MNDVSPASLTHVLTAVESAAVIAFALSGLLEAARKRLDAVGVCVVAGLTAFGGGTLRDVLLDRRPFFWVERAGWLWVLLGLCVLAMLFLRARHFAPTARAVQWPDAAGLGLFTASGTQIALHGGAPAIVAVLMGVVTATFGGVLRDIVCNEIPSAFRDHRPYALCAFAGGWVLVGLDALGAADWLGLVAGGSGRGRAAGLGIAGRLHAAALAAGRRSALSCAVAGGPRKAIAAPPRQPWFGPSRSQRLPQQSSNTTTCP